MSGDEPRPAPNRQLDFLLADFSALKAESARRLALQRVALVLYLAWAATVAASLPEGKTHFLPTAGLWVGGLMALLFWCREDIEIARLGRLIRDRIGATASTILNVPTEHILPSEVAPTISERMDRSTRRYPVIFMWLVFFLVPLLLTLHVLWQGRAEVSRLCAWNTPTPYLALVTLLAAVGTVSLLVETMLSGGSSSEQKPATTRRTTGGP